MASQAAGEVRRQDFKVVILGASGVGKTCLGLRFVKDQFVTYTASTIGASFLVKELVFNNQKVTLQIWDTAGQERFRSMAPLYYRGAVAETVSHQTQLQVVNPLLGQLLAH
jgi:small GTP-binding protein